MRAVVVGASSGLGRCIGVGLGQRGAQVALLARRRERLKAAAEEAGAGALAIECDVTEPSSVSSAIGKAAADLGGIDALVYTPAIGPLARLVDTDAATWRRVFDINVIGASLVTSAALSHLTESHGRALYLSSVSASLTPPWPGLGAYAVSKAALDKLIEAWRVEHPDVEFTRCIVGDCTGGDGDSATEFPMASDWNFDLLGELHPIWEARGLLAGCFIDVEDLVSAVDAVLRSGKSVATPSITLAPRPSATTERTGRTP
jgi:NAD(P)-dependent dehydrogenase (short-subunit alcohol dehydrogenase family)